MRRLDQLLSRYYRPIGLAGSDLPQPQALVGDLQAHYRLNVRLYVTVLVLMAAAFGGLVGLLVMRPTLDSKEFVGALAAMGGLAAALVEMARRTVREWSQAKLLAAVALNLSPEQTLQLVTKVLEAGKG